MPEISRFLGISIRMYRDEQSAAAFSRDLQRVRRADFHPAIKIRSPEF
jgi:hypothetical protein